MPLLMTKTLFFSFMLMCLACVSACAEPVRQDVETFFTDHCLDCHSIDAAEGDIVLEVQEIDWHDPHAPDFWTKVHEVLRSGEMPPADASQPSPYDREKIVAWVDTDSDQARSLPEARFFVG